MTEEQPKINRNPAAHLAPHQFKPGQSGNPGGRPKGRSLTAILRDRLEDADTEQAEKIADMLIKLALDCEAPGDRQAIKDIFERVDGKVPDRVQIDDGRKAYDVGNSPDDL